LFKKKNNKKWHILTKKTLMPRRVTRAGVPPTKAVRVWSSRREKIAELSSVCLGRLAWKKGGGCIAMDASSKVLCRFLHRELDRFVRE
jgi:hypothetical protein